ncbi:hypothetical protein AVEN_117203-1 [Araneus ventricosus]|uniref:Uncharacterized protein n=1 Tax=Araneus ventricosus TaxID=182803 RepID=A0A4Y2AWL1_ARAVE|nr:hypothetical protein AVEN_117203-1 [Araneus ventricosus]
MSVERGIQEMPVNLVLTKGKIQRKDTHRPDESPGKQNDRVATTITRYNYCCVITKWITPSHTPTPHGKGTSCRQKCRQHNESGESNDCQSGCHTSLQRTIKIQRTVQKRNYCLSTTITQLVKLSR